MNGEVPGPGFFFEMKFGRYTISRAKPASN